MNATDTIPVSTTSADLQTSEVFKAKAINFQNDIYYNMKHGKRGIALIFNHEVFDICAAPRPESRYDRDELICRLSELGFEVHVNDDQSARGIQDKLEVASGVDHSDHDCFLVAILTHGVGPGILVARDEQYKFEKVWSHFTDEMCPSLAGKPKIFITQACQGDNVQKGVEMIEHEGGSTMYTIPTHPDFLFANSTVPGYVSFRCEFGTYYIQSLCEELLLNSKTCDLVTLLTFVSRRVAIEFEAYENEKQMPCITSLLTRLIKFTDKKPLKCEYTSK